MSPEETTELLTLERKPSILKRTASHKSSVCSLRPSEPDSSPMALSRTPSVRWLDVVDQPEINQYVNHMDDDGLNSIASRNSIDACDNNRLDSVISLSTCGGDEDNMRQMHLLAVPKTIDAPSSPVTRSPGCCTNMGLGEDNARFALLAVMLVCYLLLGAGVFHLVESKQEIDNRKNYTDSLDRFFNQNKDADRSQVMQLLWMHGNATIRGFGNERPNWDFQGAFYFAGTLVSTVGYGMITPQTNLGRFLVIIYGFLGCSGAILFFNLFLERIITAMTYILRLNRSLCKRIRRLCECCMETTEPRAARKNRLPTIEVSDVSFEQSKEFARLRQKYETRRVSHASTIIDGWKPSIYGVQVILMLLVFFLIMLTAPLFSYMENWHPVAAIYYCFVTFSTTGFGDYVACLQPAVLGYWVYLYRTVNFFIMAFGCCCVYSLFNVTSITLRHFLNYLIKKANQPCNQSCKPSTLVRTVTKQSFINGRRFTKTDTDSERGDSLYETDGSRRSSGFSRRSSRVSLGEFLAQASMVQMHHQLIKSATPRTPKLKRREREESSTAITENAVGPLQILCKTFGTE